MDVYTVDVGFLHSGCKARPRITKRRVLKAGNRYLTLSPLYQQGSPVKVPLERCYSSEEQARAELAALVAEQVAQLVQRVEELKHEPELEVSYVFDDVTL